MKILQINKFFYRRGGADEHFFDLMELLQSRGQTVAPFSTRDERNEPSDYERFFVSGVDFSRVNARAVLKAGRFFHSFLAARQLRRLLMEFKPDVAHLHLIYHHLSPSILPVLKKAGVPVIMTAHDFSLVCPSYTLNIDPHNSYGQCAPLPLARALVSGAAFWWHRFRRVYERHLDAVVAPSEFTAEVLRRAGFAERKILVLPHFLPAALPPAPAVLNPPAAARFAYAGRLSKEKGIDKLLNYWHHNRLNSELIIYGDGPLSSVLERFINGNKMNNVRLRGRVERARIFKELKSFTALICPSVCHETFGLAALEAMAAGVPAVSTSSGGVEELILKSGGGELFDFNAAGSLERALRAVGDVGYRQKALSYARGHHRPADYYHHIMAIYEKARSGQI